MNKKTNKIKSTEADNFYSALEYISWVAIIWEAKKRKNWIQYEIKELYLKKI